MNINNGIAIFQKKVNQCVFLFKKLPQGTKM